MKSVEHAMTAPRTRTCTASMFTPRITSRGELMSERVADAAGSVYAVCAGCSAAREDVLRCREDQREGGGRVSSARGMMDKNVRLRT
jgi:hypothetical protein